MNTDPDPGERPDGDDGASRSAGRNGDGDHGASGSTDRDTVQHAAPYVGLRPYDEQDRSRFFGRSHDAERLINKIFSAHLTLLYAPSAAGKTSLLKTLVVPDLRDQDAEVVYFDHWTSAAPTEALIAAIARSASPERIGEEPPAKPPDDLMGACKAAIEARGRTLVLLLDQFEEFLRRHAAQPDPLRREVANLVRGNVDVRVVLSFREEFLGALDACFRDCLPALFSSTFHLGHLGEKGAREAIVAPAEPFGLSYSDALVNLILRDLHPRRAGTQPAAEGANAVEISLPFLQIVCRRLWAEAAPSLGRGEPVLLDVDTYVDKLHGRAGIVSDYLAEVTGGLHAQQRNDLAELFRWLAPPSGLKVAFPRDTLAEQTKLPAARLQRLLDLLQGKNIVRARDAGGVITYELFHDAFIDIVRPWSAERRAMRRGRQRALALSLIAGLGLIVVATAAGWSFYASRASDELRQEQQAASEARAELEAKAAEAAKAEAELAQQRLAERVRNGARRGDTKRAIDRSLAAITESGWAVDKVALRDALSAHLTMRRLRGANDRPLAGIAFAPGHQLLTFAEDGSLLLWDGDTGTQVWPAEEKAPADGKADVATSPGDRESGGGEVAERLYGAFFSTDGTRVLSFGERTPTDGAAAGGSGGFLTLSQIGRSVPAWTVALPEAVGSARFSDDDRWIAAVTDDGRLTVLDANDGSRLWTMAPGPGPFERNASPAPAILTAAFSPDSTLLATGDDRGELQLFGLAPGPFALPPGVAPVAKTSLGDAIFDLAFTPDGSHLGVAAFRTPVPPLLTLPALARPSPAGPRAASGANDSAPGFLKIAISPDGQFLATLDSKGAVSLWNARRGNWIADLQVSGKAPAVAMAFDPGTCRLPATSASAPGKCRLAVGYSDGRLRVWSTESPTPRSPKRPLFEERSQQGQIIGVAFSSRGNLLAAATRGTDARVWNLDALPTVDEIEDLLARGDAAHRSANGLRLVERDGPDKDLAVLDNSGREISRLPIAPDDRLIYGFSNDGKRILISGESGNRAFPCTLVWCADDEQVVTLARNLFYERKDPDN